MAARKPRCAHGDAERRSEPKKPPRNRLGHSGMPRGDVLRLPAKPAGRSVPETQCANSSRRALPAKRTATTRRGVESLHTPSVNRGFSGGNDDPGDAIIRNGHRTRAPYSQLIGYSPATLAGWSHPSASSSTAEGYPSSALPQRVGPLSPLQDSAARRTSVSTLYSSPSRTRREGNSARRRRMHSSRVSPGRGHSKDHKPDTGMPLLSSR